jgi:hypothetical protein
MASAVGRLAALRCAAEFRLGAVCRWPAVSARWRRRQLTCGGLCLGNSR